MKELILMIATVLALIILELRKAPEGYEDERGFHAIRATGD